VDAPPPRLDELIRTHLEALAPSERRVAEVVVADPELVAYGTVAAIAERAATSGASVVRFCARLGLSGFVELQALVRTERSTRDVRATERLSGEPSAGFLSALAAAAAAVDHLLRAIPGDDVARAAELLADPARRVLVLAAGASASVGGQAAASLDLLRAGVGRVPTDALAVGREVARLAAGDVLVAIDLPRYERWLLDAVGVATEAGAVVVAISDSMVSPLAARADVAFAVPVAESGPFDSQVGLLALVEGLIAEVAVAVRSAAAPRLAAVEATWDALDLLAPEERGGGSRA
jgi:DNA-binding MurR/RpiR family transcriptional regulator